MKKHLLILLLAFITSISASAYDFCVDGIYYDRNGSEAKVTYYQLIKYSGSVTIPASVTYSGTTYSVTSIGSSAFRDCSGLTSVTIPESVTSIGYYAFYGCSSLTSVTIPESVTSIRYYAFYGCSSLTTVDIPNSVTTIGDNAFESCSRLTSVTIGNSVTSIGWKTFYGCSRLTSVTIPNSVTSIGSEAFEDCSRLTSVTIPNSVTIIGSNAFYGCSRLTSVTIGNSVTTIDRYAFYNCESLISLTIPNSVTEIGDYAFGFCSGLTYITVDNDNPANISLGSRVFHFVPISTFVLYVPEGSTSLYAAADQWSAFTNIEEIFLSVSLTDGEAYTITRDWDDIEVSYTRTFASTNWQPLYVPFNMSFEEWNGYADVAELYNVRSEDSDNNGVIDEIVIEFNKLTEGELVPNVPYLIKPRTTGTVTFECTGKNLLAAPAENGSVNCSSTKEVFTLYGVYEPKNFSTPASAPARAASTSTTYNLVNGEFVATDAETEIPAGGIYLAITPKTGGYTTSAAPARVKLSVIGDKGGTSAIDVMESVNSDADAPYYDLMGRRVENPTRGIYIRNGRKVLVK